MQRPYLATQASSAYLRAHIILGKVVLAIEAHAYASVSNIIYGL